MMSQRLAVPELGRVFEGETISGLSEWQLLERYLERRDEAAFEALVTRHGPMVLGVCRRALGASPDADDAFQATFLVLVRRARDLGPRDAIGPWLYGVATRVAARARSQAGRRRRYEAISLEGPVLGREGPAVDPDLVEVLDAELSRLPAKYRSPLVLCYLEGRTHEEAARALRWPLGTVKGRLARARELLRSRLARRGFSPSAGIAGVLSSPDLRMIIDRTLIERTVGASTRLAAGQSIAQVVSHSVTSLVEGALGTMFYRKISLLLLAATATGLAFTTAAVLGRQPTPGGLPPDTLKKRLEKRSVESPGPVNPLPPPTPGPRGSGDRFVVMPIGSDSGRANDPKSRQILAKLEEPISMRFASETPLDDVLKYIKQATTTPTYSGIPIYVDPIGLQEAERSMNSTVQIDLEGVPLRRTLQLILTQLGLVYFVEDGLLCIRSEGSEDLLPPSMSERPPIMYQIRKAERGELTATEMKELIEVLKLRRQVMRMGTGGEAEPSPKQADEVKELLKEVRELIRLLKAEKQEKERPAVKKAAYRP